MTLVLQIVQITLLLLVAHHFWKKELTDLKGYFWPALSVKIAAGIGVGLLYMQYYLTGDTLAYFDDGKLLSALAREDISGYLDFLWNSSLPPEISLRMVAPRAIFFVKIVSFFNLLTGDNYWLIATWFSVISFSASWMLVKKIQQFIPGITIPAVVAFLFFPSVVFWTSGLIKESLACASLFFLTGVLLEAWFERAVRVRESLLAIPALVLLWTLKYYYAAIFIPVVFAGISYRFVLQPLIKPRNSVSKVFWFVLTFAVPLLLISFTRPNFYMDRFLQVIVSNNRAYNQVSVQWDCIQFYNLSPDVGSMFMNSPLALISGLFRPFIFEATNPFQVIAGVENLFVFIFAIACLLNVKQIARSPHRILIMGLCIYVGVLCIFITLSTPNFGTLSRYRVGFIPYFLMIVLTGNPLVDAIQRSWARLVP
jgi:hypothetical protein